MTDRAKAGAFLSYRLTEARQALGWSKASLADQVGVSASVISQYEQGITKPGEAVFSRLCERLQQPPAFFFHPAPTDEFDPRRVHFRSNKLKEEFYDRAKARLGWAIQYYRTLEQHLELPKLNLPHPNVPEDPNFITPAHIEGAAQAVREEWGLGDRPIPNLIRALEHNGVVVAQMELDLGRMDGLSFLSPLDRRPFMLLNATGASWARLRFDAAHELGHMLLHPNVEEATRGTSWFNLLERQAHQFAGALLLPEASWTRELRTDRPTLGTFKALKPRWKVSIGAMIMRADALGVINSDRKTQLFKQMSTRGWRKREPLDDGMFERESPALFSQATTLLAQQPLGADLVSSMFPIRKAHMSEITSLHPGFFAPNGLPVQVQGHHLN